MFDYAHYKQVKDELDQYTHLPKLCCMNCMQIMANLLESRCHRNRCQLHKCACLDATCTELTCDCSKHDGINIAQSWEQPMIVSGECFLKNVLRFVPEAKLRKEINCLGTHKISGRCHIRCRQHFTGISSIPNRTDSPLGCADCMKVSLDYDKVYTLVQFAFGDPEEIISICRKNEERYKQLQAEKEQLDADKKEYELAHPKSYVVFRKHLDRIVSEAMDCDRYEVRRCEYKYIDRLVDSFSAKYAPEPVGTEALVDEEELSCNGHLLDVSFHESDDDDASDSE